VREHSLKTELERAVKNIVILVAAMTVLSAPSFGAEPKAKSTRFWNLTGVEVTKFELAPTGTTNFGPDQCKNDKDGSVDDRERLKIVGVADGKYDARITDKAGRVCMALGVDIKTDEVFSVERDQLKDCKP
jgi:hypothetical protein